MKPDYILFKCFAEIVCYLIVMMHAEVQMTYLY